MQQPTIPPQDGVHSPENASRRTSFAKQHETSSSIGKRMSWLFSGSSWQSSRDPATSSSPHSPTAVSTFWPSINREFTTSNVNPTTVSAPGRSLPAHRPAADVRINSRRRGTSFSSIRSGGSTSMGLPLERYEAKSGMLAREGELEDGEDGTVPPSFRNTNPEEYAIQMLFLHFTRAADSKLSWALNFPLNEDPDLSSHLRAGADDVFDQILHQLGSLARQRPKAVVDALMIWRRSKSDPPPDVATLRQAAKGEPISMDVLAIVRERNSLVSIFILCRALIEVIKQTRPDTLSDDLALKLEEMVFNQLRTTDPVLIARSPNRMAIMTLFAELIGWLSNIRFLSVSDRFIAELEKLPFNASDTTDARDNRRIEMIVRAMRFLKLKIYPEAALEETSEFMQSLAKFFSKVKSVKVKHAYSEIFVELLLPIAGIAVAEVNYPNWAQGVESIYPRVLKMSEKPKHWLVAYPFLTSLLCVSRREFFLENWLAVIDSGFQKMKDKAMRQLILACTTRLLWVYLFRCTESLPSTEKRIEPLLKMLFPPGRRQIHPSDISLDHFVRIVHLIGMRDLERAIATVVLPLLGVEPNSGVVISTTIDTLSPERAIVAFRAVLLVFRDLEMGAVKPAFPAVSELSRYGGAIMPETMDSPATPLPDQLVNKRIIQSLSTKIEESMARIAIILDGTYGMQLLIEDKFLSQRNMYSMAVPSTSGSITVAGENTIQSYVHLTTLSVSYSRDRQPFFDLLRCIVSMLPRCFPSGLSVEKVAEMLARYVIHVDQDLARSSAEALKRLARWKSSASVILAAMSKLLNTLNDRYSEVLYAAFIENPGDGTMDPRRRKPKRSGLLKLYVNLLEIWRDQLCWPTDENTSSTEELSENEQEKQQRLITVTSGIGLFLLCGHSPAIRRCAIMVLKLAAEVERYVDTRKTTTALEDDPATHLHIIDLLEGTGRDLMGWNRATARNMELADSMFADEEVVSVDLDHAFWRNSAKLRQLAESENPLNSRLWNELFPILVKVIIDKYPTIAWETQRLASNRLVQMHALISWSTEATFKSGQVVTSTISTTTKSKQMVSADFVEQWAIYLRFVCASLPAPTEETRPTKSATSYGGRNRSLSLSAGSVVSAKDVINMSLSLLSVDNSAIRDAAIKALEGISAAAYPLLMEELASLVAESDIQQRTTVLLPGAKKTKRQEYVRLASTFIYASTCNLLAEVSERSRTVIEKQLRSWLESMLAVFESSPSSDHVEQYRLQEGFAQLAGKLFSLSCVGVIEQFPVHLRAQLFALLQDWSGYKADGTENHTDASKWTLELTCLRSLAKLCDDPLPVVSHPNDKLRFLCIPHLLGWIQAMYASHDSQIHRIADTALKSVLRRNQRSEALEAVIFKCFASETSMLTPTGYFSCLLEFITSQDASVAADSTLLVLALFRAGDDIQTGRKLAIALLKQLEFKYYGSALIGDELALLSEQSAVYKNAQVTLSARFARSLSQQTYQILCEMIYRLDSVAVSSQRDLLVLMRPWISNVVLALDEDRESGLNVFSEIMLNNLFYVTVRFGDAYPRELELLWREIVKGSIYHNSKIVTDYLLNMAIDRPSSDFIFHAKKVIVYLGRTAGVNGMIESLTAVLVPENVIPKQGTPSEWPTESHLGVFIANLDPVFAQFTKRSNLSPAQISLSFMVDFAVENGTLLMPYLPSLLHTALIEIDAGPPFICDQVRMLLTHIVYVNFMSRATTSPEVCDQSRMFIQHLLTRNNALGRSPDNMEQFNELVLQAANLFATLDTAFVQQWGDVALRFATHCPVRNLATSSFQVFRVLKPTFHRAMLVELLARLSNTISDPSEKIQSFTIQILETLENIVEPINEEDILQHPAVLWGAVAILYTRNQGEYSVGLDMLKILLSKIDLDDIRTQEIITHNFPTAWNAEFDGIQPLLLKGLRSTSTEPRCLQLINSLMLTDGGSVIDPSESRGLFLILCNLPRMVSALDDGEASEDIATVAEQLQEFCEHYELTRLQKIFESFQKGKFRSPDDFLKQTCVALREVYFPEFEWDALVFLTGLLSNSELWIRSAVLLITKAMLPFLGLDRAEYRTRNREIVIAPFLSLLTSSDCGDEALDILEGIMLKFGLSGGGVEEKDTTTEAQKVSRQDTVRKYAGITPTTQSGWFVGDDPDEATMRTRQNVHAALVSCIDSDASMDKLQHVASTIPTFAYDVQMNDARSEFTTRSDIFTLSGVSSHLHHWSSSGGGVDPRRSNNLMRATQNILMTYDEPTEPVLSDDATRDDADTDETIPFEDLVYQLDDLEHFFQEEANR